VKVRFCASCRRLILADFRFCPYCGEGLEPGPGLPESLENPFARLERGGVDRVGDHIDELEARLADMELELEVLLEAKPKAN